MTALRSPSKPLSTQLEVRYRDHCALNSTADASLQHLSACDLLAVHRPAGHPGARPIQATFRRPPLACVPPQAFGAVQYTTLSAPKKRLCPRLLLNDGLCARASASDALALWARRGVRLAPLA